jgi:Apea-like HEPN
MSGTLWEAVNEYFAAAHEQFSTMDKPTRMWKSPSAVGTGITARHMIDYWKAVRGIVAFLHSAPQFEALIEAIASGEGPTGSLAAARAREYWGGPAADFGMRSTQRAQEFIEGFVTIPLVDYLETGEVYGYESDAATQVLEGLVDDLGAQHHIARRTVPLTSLRIDGGPHQIATGVVVRSVERKDTENWLNGDDLTPFSGSAMPAHWDVLRIKSVADVTTPIIEGSIEALRDQPSDAMNRLLATLRLATGAHIDAPFWEERVSGMPTVVRPASVRPMPLRGVQEVPFDATNALDAAALWPKLQGYPDVQVAGLAIRRFNDAATRERAEDRLIDYWIALESLFTPDKSTELKFRAALRIGAYVGATPDERVEIYKFICISYDRRSQVVHGTEKKKPKQSIEDIAARTGEYLRRALRQVLTRADFKPEDIEITVLAGRAPGNTP